MSDWSSKPQILNQNKDSVRQNDKHKTVNDRELSRDMSFMSVAQANVEGSLSNGQQHTACVLSDCFVDARSQGRKCLLSLGFLNESETSSTAFDLNFKFPIVDFGFGRGSESFSFSDKNRDPQKKHCPPAGGSSKGNQNVVDTLKQFPSKIKFKTKT